MPVAPRFYCPAHLLAGVTLSLPAGAARHVQVLRLQPGDSITLFGGAAPAAPGAPVHGEFEATILEMGRQEVSVRVGDHRAVERESARTVHLAMGMPANERMDWLVEKATELGVAALQPLMTERSVLRLDAERARKKTAHWASIAVAACEQCGRNRVPEIRGATSLPAWAGQLGGAGTGREARYLLSLRPGALALGQAVAQGQVPEQSRVTLLAGPEGGLSRAEEELAISHGFIPVSLGPRVLRAETAALVALTLLA